MYWMDYTHHIGNIMVYSWLVCCLFLFIFHVSLHLGHEMGTWAILEALPHFGNTRAHNHICIYIYITVYIFIPADFLFLYFLYRFCPAIIDLAKWGKKNSSMVAFMMPTSCKSTPTPSHFARWRSGVNGLWPLWVVRQFGAHRLFPALLNLVRASCESVPVATPRNKI